MPENFTRAFANRLNTLCVVTVKEAEHGDPVLPGTVLMMEIGRRYHAEQPGSLARAKKLIAENDRHIRLAS